jgi:predicted nucleic acid-binding protein
MSGPDTSRLCFIDTNVWLYAFMQTQDPAKSSAARDLIKKADILYSEDLSHGLVIEGRLKVINPFAP